MSRKCRRVPKDWQHPKDISGDYIPLHELFPYNAAEIEEGLRDGWLKGEPPYYGIPTMPQWPESQRTHYQMYEEVTEGTPISPVFERPEDLARWLASTRASAFAGMGASYEHWLALIHQRSASASLVLDMGAGTVQTGVEFASTQRSK